MPAPLRDLPIFWKLLLPFLILLLVVGSAGAFVIVRDLTSKSRAALSEQLTLRAVDARSLVHDNELDLLESANYASNLQGMADAVAKRQSATVSSLLQSVLALKTDLDFVAATNDRSISVAELIRPQPDAAPVAGSGTDWSTSSTVREALEKGGGEKAAGFIRFGERPLMIMVAPICRGAPPCASVGFAIVGHDATDVAKQVAAAAKDAVRGTEDVTIYDAEGHLLTSTTKTPPPPVELPETGQIEQRRTQLEGQPVATAYTGFTLGARPGGTIAVTVPAKTAFGSVGSAALRLVGLLVLGMAAAVAVGWLVARLILRQLTTLVDTSRKLGEGKLYVRAPVLSGDEHGELAEALNHMAEQLQVSHETLELQVEQRTEEIKRLLQDRTDFFAGLSHELRTPLAIILTQAEMLLTTTAHRGARDDASETIRASASQLLDIVNDILELAQAEAGSIEVSLVPVRLHDFFQDASPMLVRLGAASDIGVKFDLPARLPTVTADPARLREILLNLVDNAVKYTPNGGGIEISATSDDEGVRISVADTGIGIPSEVGDRVFEPFYRVPETTPQRGQAASGLGLALARRWVEAQGGTISWAPNPSGGTIFDFTLQADRTQPASAPRRSALSRDGRRSPAPPRGNGGRLLRRKSSMRRR